MPPWTWSERWEDICGVRMTHHRVLRRSGAASNVSKLQPKCMSYLPAVLHRRRIKAVPDTAVSSVYKGQPYHGGEFIVAAPHKRLNSRAPASAGFLRLALT